MNNNDILDDYDSAEASIWPTLWRRFRSAFFDGIICLLVFIFFFPMKFDIISIQLVFITYKVLLEGLNNGQTFGKQIFGFQAVNDDGTHSTMNLATAFKRSIFFLLGLLLSCWEELGVLFSYIVVLFFYVVSILSALKNEYNRTWYDRYAGSVCIKKKNYI